MIQQGPCKGGERRENSRVEVPDSQRTTATCPHHRHARCSFPLSSSARAECHESQRAPVTRGLSAESPQQMPRPEIASVFKKKKKTVSLSIKKKRDTERERVSTCQVSSGSSISWRNHLNRAQAACRISHQAPDLKQSCSTEGNLYLDAMVLDGEPRPPSLPYLQHGK